VLRAQHVDEPAPEVERDDTQVSGPVHCGH
jgi:hypothetical protein